MYATPQTVDTPDGLFFYHSIDLPGVGSMQGDWDLRADTRAYLGNVDFRGKRALDVGTAGGYLTFKMEEYGANVVSHDIGAGSDWDIVPHYKLAGKLPAIRAQADRAIDSLKRAYWFSHRALGSKAQAYYGSVYSLPAELGQFDVVVYGMILTHLRDPFLALYQGARLCRDTLIVTGIWSAENRPVATFRPSADDTSNLGIKSWWFLSKSAIEAMVGTMGFKVVATVPARAIVNAAGSEGERMCEALVAKRIG